MVSMVYLMGQCKIAVPMSLGSSDGLCSHHTQKRPGRTSTSETAYTNLELLSPAHTALPSSMGLALTSHASAHVVTTQYKGSSPWQAWGKNSVGWAHKHPPVQH